jgi:hypothetical protein
MGRAVMTNYFSWLGKAQHRQRENSIARIYVAYLLLPVVLVLSIFCQTTCQAAESRSNSISLQQKGFAGVNKYKINSNFNLRGWKLSPDMYLGQTKAFGSTRYGLLIDKGDYAYGLTNQQFSIFKSF